MDGKAHPVLRMTDQLRALIQIGVKAHPITPPREIILIVYVLAPDFTVSVPALTQCACWIMHQPAFTDSKSSCITHLLLSCRCSSPISCLSSASTSLTCAS